MSKFLSAKNICKHYKSADAGRIQVLDNVSLEINKGDWAMLIGSSGSGKSTFLNILGTLDKADSGQLMLEGKDYSKFSAMAKAKLRQEQLGFVFQSFQLIPELTALENVMLPAQFSSRSTQAKKRALELLDRVGLSSRSSHHPGALSGGEQQRVAICRALINDPDIILADEPTGNLDPDTSAELIKFFSELRKQGKTIVMVTHDHQLKKYATKVFSLDQGKLKS
jgi:putative ABC transport system ATP-binding protein